MNKSLIVVAALGALGIAFSQSKLAVFADDRTDTPAASTASPASENRKSGDGWDTPYRSSEAFLELPKAIKKNPEATGSNQTQAEENVLEPTDPVGQYELAKEYADKNNPRYDMQQALFWFEKAGNKGHIRAQREVGDIYRYGKGVEIDTDRALWWYQAFYMNDLKLIGGTNEDMDAMHKAAIELMVAKKKARDVQPKKEMTAYELGEAIGTMLKYGSENNSRDNTASAPAGTVKYSQQVKACRDEAMKHIITCAKVTDYQNCETWGCPEIIQCDKRLTSCDDHGAPYDRSGNFYCDMRDWRTRDFDLEAVLKRACPAQ
ncbi:Sel1 repeat protein [Methylophaga frappieri]|uniref:Sel1 repeat protein n=1 Tax=Methylophaga frappieri (strain ATCC BAA-2434 / DSM 25690 / JAM7) TaxID=754477 RepID=I1YIH5_METFJ|nr:tetratricopeptide repeat protein [Methylophaga frappieri]AFJ02718.1 Sel1 repeat protein [Methylophaga frappieri]